MWTPEHTAVLRRFAAFAGLPHSDEDARAWTRQLAEQFAASFPREGWGTKQASLTRPRSTDVICTRSPFVGYDVIGNQGLPDQALILTPHPLDLTGQVFLPVNPVDHIGGQTPVPLPGPTKPGGEFPPRDLALSALTALNALYRDRKHPERGAGSGLYINDEGIAVWFGDYLRRYVTGDHTRTSDRPSDRHAACVAAVTDDIAKASRS